MPKRPSQHEIDELAQRTFREALPPSWVVNALTPDYAKDYLVEVVEKSDLTGKLFVVQLKGKQRATVRAKDQTLTVPIDRDHLRYYLQQMPLPVFVVAADVSGRRAYFDFAQRQIERVASLRASVHRSGMATFRVPIANRLDDTSLLLRELNAAWGFMREKYPGSVHAAMACRVRLLKGLDPRFDYRVTVVDGNDHVELHPIEPVQFTLSVTGEPDAVAVKLKDFVGQGEALKADGNIGIEVTGSPIFALGKIVSVSMTPRRPVEARLFAELKGRGRVHFPEFRGNLDGGTELLKFEGRLPRCPLSVLVTARRHDADAGKLTFTWKWNPTVWVGHPLASLPWIDPLLQLLNALGDPAATLGFTLTSHGQHIGEGIAAEQANLEHVRAIHPYVDFLGKAKRVASVLHLPVVVPREWTEEDFQDVEELYSLVTTGRYDHRGTFGFTCTIARLASSVVEGLVKRPSEHLQLSNHGSRYNFLGDSFDFSDTHIQLSHWTNVSAEDVTEAGEPLTKLQLSRCRQTVVWPRFLPEKPQDAASP